MSRQIFEQAGRARGWLGTLRKFGLGELSAQQLESAASGVVDKTEAQFYAALSLTQPKEGDWKKRLSEVAQSPAIDLVEVRLAADLLARSEQPTTFAQPLPQDIELP
jgi:hypothetical protein